MHIRVELSKGLNLEKLVGKEIILSGVDVETGKYYEISIVGYGKGAYVRLEETTEPAPVKKKRAKRAKKLDMKEEDMADGE